MTAAQLNVFHKKNCYGLSKNQLMTDIGNIMHRLK